MVKVAFVVEGKVEKIFIDYLRQSGWLEKKGIIQVGPTIDAKGGGNLCPKNISVYIEQAKVFQPQSILILTDLECDPCITLTKTRIGGCDICSIVVARKAIEAWFLADNFIVEKLSHAAVRQYDSPERTDKMPYEEIKAMMLKHTGRGSGSKVALAKKVMKLGFDVSRSATHSDCLSAAYFVNKITHIGGGS
jgi:hypothetical protein